ncbi:MAG: PadR family transcriptional regulator [Eubacteriales bacterium]|nr:PadR family transcriptional regulator [Eubacteriales bacterium]
MMLTNKQYLEALVLSILSESENGRYPYEIKNILGVFLKLSDSTIYTIFNRLEKQEFVRADEKLHISQGRARKYYFITEEGNKKLQSLKDRYHIEKDILDRWLE